MTSVAKGSTRCREAGLKEAPHPAWERRGFQEVMI